MSATLTAPRHALLTASPDPAAWRAVAKDRAALWRRHALACRACLSGERCRRADALASDADDAGTRWDVAERLDALERRSQWGSR